MSYPRERWTPEQDAILLEMWQPGVRRIEIARRVGRSYEAVQQRYYYLQQKRDAERFRKLRAAWEQNNRLMEIFEWRGPEDIVIEDGENNTLAHAQSFDACVDALPDPTDNPNEGDQPCSD